MSRVTYPSPELAAERVTASRFDDALFSGPMILIDSTNECAGIVPTTAAAREAVSSGRATTWAAQVRPGVVAIDVDLEHRGLAREIATDLTEWAHIRGLWATTRPSGGGRGRLHVVVAAGSFDDALRTRVEDWRVQCRLTARQLDIRGTIRPFLAPHRRTGAVHIPTTLAVQDLSLIAHVVNNSAPRRLRVTSEPPRLRDLRRQIFPMPMPNLPSVRSRDTSRSGIEFAQSLALYNAGVSEENAWQCVSSPLNSKSGERGRHWWQVNIWERIRPRPKGASTFNLAAVILPTIKANRHRYRDLHPRTRNILETVLMVLLEKLQNKPENWIPVSERDLQLCTGLSRHSIRSAATRLIELGIVERQRAVRIVSAHSYRLGPNCSQSLTAPSILTPPPSHWIPACPVNSAHTLLEYYAPTDLTDRSSLSYRQRCLHARAQQELEVRGVLPSSLGVSASTVAHDQSLWRQRLESITAERDVFYARYREALIKHRCLRAQRNAVRRARWWASLAPEEQRKRRRQWKAAFAALSPAAQERRRMELFERRELATGAKCHTLFP